MRRGARRGRCKSAAAGTAGGMRRGARAGGAARRPQQVRQGRGQQARARGSSNTSLGLARGLAGPVHAPTGSGRRSASTRCSGAACGPKPAVAGGKRERATRSTKSSARRKRKWRATRAAQRTRRGGRGPGNVAGRGARRAHARECARARPARRRRAAACQARNHPMLRRAQDRAAAARVARERRRAAPGFVPRGVRTAGRGTSGAAARPPDHVHAPNAGDSSRGPTHRGGKREDSEGRELHGEECCGLGAGARVRREPRSRRRREKAAP